MGIKAVYCQNVQNFDLTQQIQWIYLLNFVMASAVPSGSENFVMASAVPSDSENFVMPSVVPL